MIEIEPDWIKAREWWYSQTYILFELAKLLSHRELVVLEKPNPSIVDRKPKTIRCCCGYTIDLIKSNFNSFRILDFPFVNMYYSLMTLDKMPLFSFAPSIRAQKYIEWTNGGYKEHYTGYDFGLDFDGETIEQARQDLMKVKRLFDQYKIPHSIRFSGSRGFHLCVESRWLPQLPENKIVPMLGELATMMKEIDNIPSLDDTIFDSRRVFKLPYSFDRGNIVLPLDDYQLANFTMQMVSPEYVIKAIKLKNRGILERYTDQPEPQARESFLKMASNFIDIKPYFSQKI
jgi:hypothetical protein